MAPHRKRSGHDRLPAMFVGLAAAAWVTVLSASPAAGQLPSLQGVQPIFNNQLGAWSATQPAATAGPNSSGIRQRHYTVRVPRGGWWWGYPYYYGGAPLYPPYPYYYGGYRYHSRGYDRWNGYSPLVTPPVVVVQPQIVVPPAVGSTVPVMPGSSPSATPQVSGPPTPHAPVGASTGTAGAAAGPTAVVAGTSTAAAAQEIAQRVAKLRPSDEAARMRADQLLADGDREFAAGQYRRAANKYREAMRRAADYPDSYFRAGHAGVAVGDYDLAVTYFCMGLELARTSNRDGFTLDALYRGNDAAKAEHLRALDAAAARQPLAGSLAFLTGITQHYDGHLLPAREQFRRAAELPGRHQPYTDYFLTQ